MLKDRFMGLLEKLKAELVTHKTARDYILQKMKESALFEENSNFNIDKLEKLNDEIDELTTDIHKLAVIIAGDVWI